MAGNALYHDVATHPHLGTGTQYHDPDYDSPWWCDDVTLPNGARCETCKHWLGVCLATEGRVTRAEDRCVAWRPHPQYLTQVKAARARWIPSDASSESARWYRDYRRKKRIAERARRGASEAR
jgi:hypothetical protein